MGEAGLLTRTKAPVLLDALDAYHSEPDYYEMLAIAAKSPGQVPRAIVDFLRDWGGMARNLPESGPQRRRLETALARWLRTNRATVERLERERIWSTDFDEIGPSLVELFDSLAWIRKGFASTAAGKMLHIILPQLCVLWDGRYVRTRQRYRDDGKGYVEYLRSRQAVLADLLEEAKQATGLKDPEANVEWIVDQHASRFASCRPPVTKLLDELNYEDSESVQTYLASIRDRIRADAMNRRAAAKSIL